MATLCVVRRHRFGVVCRLFGVIGVLCAGTQADAAAKRWNNISGGAFNAAANWTGGIPGSTDTAEFGVANLGPGTYTVDFDVSPTNQAIRVEDDIVTFDLNGRTDTTTATTGNEIGTVVGQNGQLTVTDGIWNLPLAGGIFPVIEVGAVAGAMGTLIASTGGQIQGTDLVIGADGAGVLTVQNGGDVLTKQTSIGFAAPGTATITGAGSTLVNNTSLSFHANSTMTISQGGLVQNTAASISGGTVTVTDLNSRWNNTQDLFLGEDGTQLTIANGGRVDSENGWVGFAAEGAQAFVGDANPGGSLVSQWIISGLNGGTFVVGASKILVPGRGSLDILANGRVQNVDGYVAGGANSTGVATLSSPSAQWLNSGPLSVGDGGNGRLDITAGTVQNVDGIVGNEAAAVGVVNVNGPNSLWTNTGSLLVGSSGRGTVNVTAGGRLNTANSVIGVNTGSVGELTVDGANSIWTASGPILVSSFAPGTGTLTVRNGGTVNAQGGLSVRVLGTLQGDGQINGNVGNVGIVAPGTSPGALKISGNFTQGASGKLDIDLGGTTAGSQYDQLLVTGSATLAGTLAVSLTGGFTPSIGNVFEVVHANSGVLGGFPNLSFPPIPNGMAWTIIYTGVAVFLNVQSGPLLGDFNNNNNTVDAADYIVWRNSEGTMTSLPNSGGISGTIGQAHYNLWRSHFGDVRPSGSAQGSTRSASANVPEPTAIALALVTCASALMIRIG